MSTVVAVHLREPNAMSTPFPIHQRQIFIRAALKYGRAPPIPTNNARQRDIRGNSFTRDYVQRFQMSSGSPIEQSTNTTIAPVRIP